MASAPGNQRLPWLRIVAESAAIVLSILLAFAIDAWWDYRQDRAEEREILVELGVEYEMYARVLGRRAAFYDSITVQIEWLLNDSGEDEEASVERFAAAFGPLVGAPTYDFASEVLGGLIASGRLGVVRNDELRSRLSNWSWVRANTMEDEAVVREYVGGVLIPFLAERNVPMGRSFAGWRGDSWGIDEGDQSEAIRAYRAVAADPEFRGLAMWRYDWALSSVRMFTRASEEADEIRRLIEEQLVD